MGRRMELLRMLAIFAGSVGLLRHDDDVEDDDVDKEDVDVDVPRAAITTTESATTIKVEIAIPSHTSSKCINVQLIYMKMSVQVI